MRHALVTVSVVLGLAAVPVTTAAPSRGPQLRTSAADTRSAKSILLSEKQLGAGAWKATLGSASAPACGIVLSLQPDESSLVETANVTGSLFTNTGYEALTQSVRVFASPRQAAADWSRTVDKNLVICMEQQIENTSTMGAPVSVTDWRALRLPNVSPRVAGFRVVANAKTSAAKTTKVYLDVILLGRGRTTTKVVLSSIQRPFASSFESRVSRLIGQRLASA